MWRMRVFHMQGACIGWAVPNLVEAIAEILLLLGTVCKELVFKSRTWVQSREQATLDRFCLAGMENHSIFKAC